MTQQAHDVVRTSMRRNDISTSCARWGRSTLKKKMLSNLFCGFEPHIVILLPTVVPFFRRTLQNWLSCLLYKSVIPYTQLSRSVMKFCRTDRISTCNCIFDDGKICKLDKILTAMANYMKNLWGLTLIYSCPKGVKNIKFCA